MSAFRDEWGERDPRLDKWASPRDRGLDRRLGLLGYMPQSGYHADECPVWAYRGAPCTCREVVAREARRRRGSGGGVLTR